MTIALTDVVYIEYVLRKGMGWQDHRTVLAPDGSLKASIPVLRSSCFYYVLQCVYMLSAMPFRGGCVLARGKVCTSLSSGVF